MMHHDLPKDVLDHLRTKFTTEEVELINKNWDRFSNGFSFNSASYASIVSEARMVLECSRRYPV